MSTTDTGRAAESLAAGWLDERGFTILDRNWRTRWCELDIVASKGSIVHFVEVKYRRHSGSGDGFDAVTRDKAVRLMRAADMWLKANAKPNADYQIDIIAISGLLKPNNVSYLPNAIAWF